MADAAFSHIQLTGNYLFSQKNRATGFNLYHVQSNMNGVELDHSFKDGLKENGQVGVNTTIRNNTTKMQHKLNVQNNTETSLKATLTLSLWRPTVSRHEDMLNTTCDKI